MPKFCPFLSRDALDADCYACKHKKCKDIDKKIEILTLSEDARDCLRAIKSAYNVCASEIENTSPSFSRIFIRNMEELEHVLITQEKLLAEKCEFLEGKRTMLKVANSIDLQTKAEENEKKEKAEDRVLIEELRLDRMLSHLLKRNNIFFIDSLETFLSSHSLTELYGCGGIKAEKILRALEEYKKQKQ